VLSTIEIPSSALSVLPIKGTSASISQSFLTFFITMFITVNCFMAALLLGLISKGKEREGLKYVIPMILLSIPLFFLTRTVIRSVLGGLFGI